MYSETVYSDHVPLDVEHTASGSEAVVGTATKPCSLPPWARE